jgi:TatD DNase family protein
MASTSISEMIDSHCHLTDPRLFSQLDEVLSRATAAGVTRIITIGTSIADAQATIALCRGRDNVRCAIGIHPNHSHEANLDDVNRLRDLQADPSVVALGEMGLDYFHNFSDRARQKTFFEAQLKLAAELSRPIVIHSREAIADTLEILKHFPTVPAVFHSFTGTLAESEQIFAAGYSMGFTGPITFKKNDLLREVVAKAPHERVFVETDAPWLSPEPMRKQKTNEPAFVIHTAAVVAREWGVNLQHVDEIASDNAQQFFSWAKS